MKKSVSVVLILVLLITCIFVTPAFADGSYKPAAGYEKYVKELVSAGILDNSVYNTSFQSRITLSEAQDSRKNLADFLGLNETSDKLPALYQYNYYTGGWDSIFDIGYGITREAWFIKLSDAAWANGRDKMLPYAVKPPAPKQIYANRYYYRSGLSLWWDGSYANESYRVSFYSSSGKLIKTLSVYGTWLSLSDYSAQTVKSVFGTITKNKKVSVRISAIDKHGISSSPSARKYFIIDKHYNQNEKFFGSRNRFGFKSATQARKYQKTITVKVWKLSGGKKVSSSMRLTVNKAVAGDIKNVFKEIYKGKEKFPMKSVGGFQVRASKTSEHNYGTAIDINPNENYMCQGKRALVGSFWKPKTNPYSIRPNGDVVKAFEKYGWRWGGLGWGDRYDYMHFSYFGG